MIITLHTTAGTLFYDGTRWTAGNAFAETWAERLNSEELPEAGSHDTTADRCVRLARSFGLEPVVLSVDGLNEDTGEDVTEGTGEME